MLKGFEVHAVGPAEIQQRVELGADRERERVIEAPFFDHFGTDRLSTDRLSVTRAPGCCQPGLTQRIADLDQLLGQAPKTPIFGVSARMADAAGAGMRRVAVLPDRFRVSDRTGPRPASAGGAQPQRARPHRRQRSVSEPERISPIDAN